MRRRAGQRVQQWLPERVGIRGGETPNALGGGGGRQTPAGGVVSPPCPPMNGGGGGATPWAGRGARMASAPVCPRAPPAAMDSAFSVDASAASAAFSRVVSIIPL